VSSQIDLKLTRCGAVGCLAAAPWLAASAFLLIAGAAGKHWMYGLVPLTLAGALVQYRLNGLLAGPSAVVGLSQNQNTLYARLGNGQVLAVSACPSSRMNSKMALLKLKPAASKYTAYSVVLLSTTRITGNLPEDQFRRLRMWLRLGRAQQPSE
jgi:toxin CptA